MNDEPRDPLDLLGEQFLSRVRKGEALTVDAFAAEHPEHATGLRDLLPTLLLLEQAKRDRETSGTGARLASVPKLERLGEFRIVREVGRGGMGVVFEAEQESLTRRVALKVLPQASLLSGHQLERFLREAQIASRLHHTNIVPVFDSGEDEGYHYYAMQFIDGQGLDAWILQRREAAERGAIRDASHWRACARMGASVAGALAHAHEQGTLHRDIKPANLLLDAQDHVWVTDFGLAKALQNEKLTMSGDVLGTLQYMAPEQFDGHYDGRSEVYALAATLYEAIALRPAFASRTRAELIDRIRAGRCEPLSRVAPGVPRDLETIVSRAMAVGPDARYRTPEQLAEDLEAFLDDRPIAARRQSSRELFVYWCRRNRALATTGAVAVVAMLLAAVTGWSAYLVRTDALQRTEASAREARIKGELAQGNLMLAMQFFEELFDTLVGPDPLHALVSDVPSEDATAAGEESGESDAVVALRAPVDAEDLQVLQRMLEFYDRFAEKNVESSGLAVEVARAYRRVGAIHAALGDLPSAAMAYEKSLARYRMATATDVTRDQAAVFQELGQVQLLQREPLAARSSFLQSLRHLERDGADTSRSAGLLTARGHYLASSAWLLEFRGGRRWPPTGPSGRLPRPDAPPSQRDRPRPNAVDDPRPADREARREEMMQRRTEAETQARRHLEAAQQMLLELPVDIDTRNLQARCRLTELRLVRSREQAEPLRREAIEMLEQLVVDAPQRHDIRFQLLSELMRLSGGGRRGLRRLAPQDLTHMLEHARVLVEQQPGQKPYRALRASLLSASGSARASRPGEEEAAMRELEQAAAIERDLIQQVPDDVGYALQLFETLRRSCRVHLQQGRVEQAKACLAEALDLVAGWTGEMPVRGRFAGGLEDVGGELRTMAARVGLEERLQQLREQLRRRR
jgi:tetratricopeptide (TPR) repeat protein